MPRDDIKDDASSSQRTARDANTEGYDPLTPTQWSGGVDPGTVKDALDVLAAGGAMNPVGAARMFGRAPGPPEVSQGQLILQGRIFGGWN